MLFGLDKMNEIQLETICPRCEGEGKVTAEHCKYIQKKCGRCDGKGYELTDFGEKVLKTVRRHLKINTIFQEEYN